MQNFTEVGPEHLTADRVIRLHDELADDPGGGERLARKLLGQVRDRPTREGARLALQALARVGPEDRQRQLRVLANFNREATHG